MDSTYFFVLFCICQILTPQTIALDANSLSSPVSITRSHRRINGFTFNSFRSHSLVSCSLQCQRQPRCVSVNFRKIVSIDETKGVCELNNWGIKSPIEENEDLEYEEGTVYAQIRDMKQDCQLTGCLDEGFCTFNEASKAFICVNHCAGSPCANGGSCRNLADDYKCTCIEGQFTGKQCEQVCSAPLGMESGAIQDSQISASSEYDSNHVAHQGRLHFQRIASLAGSWSSRTLDANQWLQVDLGSAVRVTGVATQGRNGYNQYVKKYKLQYGKDGQTFTFYRRNGENSDTIFQGNSDVDTVVYHQLNPILEARYVRVLPVEWNHHISMRMELYTC